MILNRSRANVAASIALVVAGATGRDSRFADVARGVLVRIANSLTSQIQQDFIVKSRRGTGRDGIHWPELQPETVARRTVSPRDEREVRKQLKELRERAYRDELARLRASAFSSFEPRTITKADLRIDDVLIKRARRYAKELADAAAKQLRRQVLSTREVDILRDTGAMLKAFTPGVGLNEPSNPGQIFDVRPGFVTVGNKEKPWHQLGNDNLPARSSWPADDSIPEAWWPAIILAAERGMRDALFLVIKAGRIPQ
jgi:hypothetical protein